MKRLCSLLCVLTLLLGGCGRTVAPPDTAWSYSFCDANGHAVTVRSLDRVAVLYGSFAETWVLGGGRLCAATEDYVTERGGNTDGVTIIGTVKAPNVETLLALSPTLVILSADIAAHATLADTLRQMQIPTACMRVDSFEDYYQFLRIVTDMTARANRFQVHGIDVKHEIEAVLDRTAAHTAPSVLLLRAYSTGVKVKADDNFVGTMLSELGGQHVSNSFPSLLEELSLETILQADPSCIFVTTMGDEQAALAALQSSLYDHPAWQSLSAVQNGQVFVLPKELFHYKPNARWGESYRYLESCLYGKDVSP